jgi:hypothetical protein
VTPNEGGGVSYNLSKQSRVQWLQAALGKKAPGLVNQLASLQPHELADAVQQVWHEKGGEGAKQDYVAKLETIYRQLTGKDIREVPSATAGDREAFALSSPTKETIERSQDLAADAARQVVPEKASTERVQDDLFKKSRNPTLDSERIIQGVEGLTGEAKYEALRQNAKAESAREAVRDVIERNVNESGKNGARSQPESTNGAAGTENARAGDEVPQVAGNADTGQSAQQAAQVAANKFAGDTDALTSRQQASSSVAERQNGNRGGQSRRIKRWRSHCRRRATECPRPGKTSLAFKKRSKIVATQKKM